MGSLCKKDSAQVTIDRTEASGKVENVAFDAVGTTSDSVGAAFDAVGAAFDAIDTAFDAVASFNV